MYKRPAFVAARGELSRSGIFKTFDNSLKISECFAYERGRWKRTVLPEPLHPTIRVKGVLNFMASLYWLSKERIL
jgi:hypothetical protein